MNALNFRTETEMELLAARVDRALKSCEAQRDDSEAALDRSANALKRSELALKRSRAAMDAHSARMQRLRSADKT